LLCNSQQTPLWSNESLILIIGRVFIIATGISAAFTFEDYCNNPSTNLIGVKELCDKAGGVERYVYFPAVEYVEQHMVCQEMLFRRKDFPSIPSVPIMKPPPITGPNGCKRRNINCNDGVLPMVPVCHEPRLFCEYQPVRHLWHGD